MALVALVALAIVSSLFVACGSSSETGSDQFRDQTDSPNLDFGEEGDEAELEQGAAAVQVFFTARAEGDWPRACAQLARPVLKKIERLATSATALEETSCPAFLDAFLRLTAKERRDSTVVDAGSLRQQGNRGFLIYYGADEVIYSMPLSRENGEWKLAELSADRLG